MFYHLLYITADHFHMFLHNIPTFSISIFLHVSSYLLVYFRLLVYLVYLVYLKEHHGCMVLFFIDFSQIWKSSWCETWKWGSYCEDSNNCFVSFKCMWLLSDNTLTWCNICIGITFYTSHIKSYSHFKTVLKLMEAKGYLKGWRNTLKASLKI